jgi:hypothetical protein
MDNQRQLYQHQHIQTDSKGDSKRWIRSLAKAGNYTVAVKNSLGTVTSSPATLTVDAAPVITTQPASLTVVAGGSATFSVVATGNPAPSYQWNFAGAAITGATSASLTLSGVQLSQAGSYTVTISNSLGSVTSKAAVLTVDAAPVITTQPVSQTVVSGANVTFSITTTGYPAPTYQWYLNGAAITGATKATYTITGAKAANAGTYTVKASNSQGSATSNAATLVVNVPPAITTQPASQSVSAGVTVTFSVVATGTPVLDYQWTFDGSPISGATSSSLVLTNVQSANVGNYSVTVSNDAGVVTSKTVTLNVK